MKGLYRLVQRNRRRFNEDTRGTQNRERFSPSTLGRYRETVRRIEEHATGRTLDVGCGDMTFREHVLRYAASYDGLDIELRAPGVTYLGDAQNMDMVPSGSYATVLCLEVLEHVPDPARAVAEIFRVLGSGGKLIVSVPHLSRLHEEPIDFYRYTKYGLAYLLETAGFEVLEICPRGGVFCFSGHQVSTLLLGLTWHVPGLRRLAFALNLLLVVGPCLWLDRILEKKKVFALGYVGVARKP